MPPTCPRVPAFEVVPGEGELDRHLLRGGGGGPVRPPPPRPRRPPLGSPTTGLARGRRGGGLVAEVKLLLVHRLGRGLRVLPGAADVVAAGPTAGKKRERDKLISPPKLDEPGRKTLCRKLQRCFISTFPFFLRGGAAPIYSIRVNFLPSWFIRLQFIVHFKWGNLRKLTPHPAPDSPNKQQAHVVHYQRKKKIYIPAIE